MTEIQRLAIPAILQGGDVIAKSRTGSGKTLAFLIPAVEMVVNTLKNKDSREKRGTYVLIIVPTHELAVQTFTHARKLLCHHEFITVGVSMGGAELSNEIELFSSHPHILIVTPGRFAEHLHLRNMRARDFVSLKLLVFDEADRILDMGWKIEISRIMSVLPENRQTVLFGATVSSESVGVSGIKSTALFINTSEKLTNEECLQEYKITSNATLLRDLSHLLTQNKNKKTIVFFQTVRIAELMRHTFARAGWSVRMLHGRMEQRERSAIFDDFLESKFDVLFSTNVAARGLDIPHVEVIIQVGIPEDMDEYIHRIGRTARAGQSGHAILLARPFEKFFVDKLQEQKIKVAEIDFQSNPVEFTNDFANLDQPAIVSYLGYLAGNKSFLGFLNVDVVREVRDFVRGLKIPRININPSVVEKLKIPLDAFQRNELSRPRGTGTVDRAPSRNAYAGDRAPSRNEYTARARENERGHSGGAERTPARNVRNEFQRNELPRAQAGMRRGAGAEDARTRDTFWRNNRAGRENERTNFRGNFDKNYAPRNNNREQKYGAERRNNRKGDNNSEQRDTEKTDNN